MRMLVSRYVNGESGTHFNARRGLVLKLHFRHYRSTLAHYKAFQHGMLALPDFYDSLVILGYQFSLTARVAGQLVITHLMNNNAEKDFTLLNSHL